MDADHGRRDPEEHEAVADPQEAGAIGCALAVAAALGAYEGYRELKKVVRIRRTFEPDPACC